MGQGCRQWCVGAGTAALVAAIAGVADPARAHGPEQDTAAAVQVQWLPGAARRINAVAALFGEGLFPREPDAHEGYFVRCMAGLTFPGGAGELTMFGSVDAGNGIGLLVNHQDVRFSGGFRYAPFAR